MEQLPWWVAPFAMCLVLTGIHGYLGIHVLERKVIFVDLAMAQIAALGAAYAIFLGYDPKDPKDAVPIYLFSLGFTLVGAVVFALTRMRKERVPHEAFIGITYASAGALAILILAKTPTEGDQIKHMLVGSLLTVTWTKVAITATIYAAIGAFHWAYRGPFFLASRDPAAAEAAGYSLRWWDFLFYVSFGVVITSSVSIAGVLLVFSYLVVPAVIAVMFAERTRVRIAVAWGVGALVSVLGVLLSYVGDLPTGPSIVAGFTAVLLLAGLVHYVGSHERSGVAVRRLALGAVFTGAALWGTTLFRKGEALHPHEEKFTEWVSQLKSEDPNIVLDALHHLEETKDTHAVPHIAALVEQTKSDRILEHAVHALEVMGMPEAGPALRNVGSRELDGDLLVKIATALLELHDVEGFPILIRVMETAEARLAREEARRVFTERSGLTLPSEGSAAIRKAREWWKAKGAALKWRSQTRRFE